MSQVNMIGNKLWKCLIAPVRPNLGLTLFKLRTEVYNAKVGAGLFQHPECLHDHQRCRFHLHLLCDYLHLPSLCERFRFVTVFITVVTVVHET